jgi:hypothetical protein
MVSGVVLAGSAVRSGFGIVVLIVIASWALLFAVLFGMLIYVTVLRGRRLRRKRVAPGPAVSADPNLPSWRRPGTPIRISTSSCCLMPPS